MDNDRPRNGLLPRLLLALGGAAVLGVVVLTMLGSQVSGILSTVGASVGSPYDGGAAPGEDGGETAGENPGAGENQSDGDGSGTSGSGSQPGVGGALPVAVPRAGLLVIKNGSLELQVEEVDRAVTLATQRITVIDGYASGSDRSGTGTDATATITFRVPADRWDEALEGLRGLAIEVLGEHSTTEDVTAQVVDLDARIRNLQATERALQAIMDRADVIKDVLSVQAQLTTVRGEIERLTAEKAHLEEQAAYSTIKVTFTLKPAPVLEVQQAGFDPGSEVDAASAKLVRILQRVATAGIWFGIVWLPVLLALGVFGVIVFVVGRRAHRAWTGGPSAGEVAGS
jgi:Domain of unknown function (DUF4349)